MTGLINIAAAPKVPTRRTAAVSLGHALTRTRLALRLSSLPLCRTWVHGAGVFAGVPRAAGSSISVRMVCQEQVQRVRRDHRRRLRLPAVRGERAATSWTVAASARRAVVSADRSASRRSHHLVTPARTATRIRTAGTKISNGHCSTNRSSTARLPLGPRPIWSPALSVAARDHPVVSTLSSCRVAPRVPVTYDSVSPTHDSSAGPQVVGGAASQPALSLRPNQQQH